MQAGGAERAERFFARALAASLTHARLARDFAHTQDLDVGEVPRIPEETGIVKHQRAIGASFGAAALFVVLARFVQRRRKGGGKKRKTKPKPPSKKKAS